MFRVASASAGQPLTSTDLSPWHSPNEVITGPLEHLLTLRRLRSGRPEERYGLK